MSEKETKAVQVRKDVTALVLDKVNSFVEAGALKMPKDYSAENALKAAYIVLSEKNEKTGKALLETCTTSSIAESLLKMVVWGVSPLKKQCYFIPYADRLECTLDYSGNILLAKRYGGLKDINAQVIYDGDDYLTEIDPATGVKKLVKHIQTMKSVGLGKILGAYAITLMEDGTSKLEEMTIQMIENAWKQGGAKGNSPAHRNFADQMAKKTVINRACKLLVRASDDGVLFATDDTEELKEIKDEAKSQVSETIKQRANKTHITMSDIEDAEVEEIEAVEEAQKAEKKEPTPKKDAVKKEPEKVAPVDEQEDLFADEPDF